MLIRLLLLLLSFWLRHPCGMPDYCYKNVIFTVEDVKIRFSSHVANLNIMNLVVCSEKRYEGHLQNHYI